MPPGAEAACPCSGRMRRAPPHRAQRRLEREQRRDDADHVVERRADRPRWDQREERDRQRDHEGEQRGRADLRFAAPSAAPKAAKPAPPARIATSQSTKRSHSSETKSSRPASISRVTASETTMPSSTFSVSSPAPRRAAGEPRECVLLALQRQRAGDQQHRHEHQRHRRGDGDREDVEGGVSPVTTSLSTLIGWVTEVSSVGEAEVLGRQPGEAE